MINKLIPASIGKDIEKACQSIYPLYYIFVREAKMLKNSKKLWRFLVEVEGTGEAFETDAQVELADGYEPPKQKSV